MIGSLWKGYKVQCSRWRKKGNRAMAHKESITKKEMKQALLDTISSRGKRRIEIYHDDNWRLTAIISTVSLGCATMALNRLASRSDCIDIRFQADYVYRNRLQRTGSIKFEYYTLVKIGEIATKYDIKWDYLSAHKGVAVRKDLLDRAYSLIDIYDRDIEVLDLRKIISKRILDEAKQHR